MKKDIKHFYIVWTTKTQISKNSHPKIFATWSSYSPKYKNLSTALRHLKRYQAKYVHRGEIVHEIRATGSNDYITGLFMSFLPYSQLEK